VSVAQHVLAIDQGTTSSRAIVFDRAGAPVAISQRELEQHYPRAGWVEHDPETIWRDVLEVGRDSVAKAGLAGTQVAAIGITNQRESVVLWALSTKTTGSDTHPRAVASRYSGCSCAGRSRSVIDGA
jgi:glycerol kinase